MLIFVIAPLKNWGLLPQNSRSHPFQSMSWLLSFGRFFLPFTMFCSI